PCTATSYVFLFHDTSTTQIYTLSLHDALPIFRRGRAARACVPISESVQGGSLPALRCLGVGRGIRSLHHVAPVRDERGVRSNPRSEEHTSELQSRGHLVCRLLLEKKKRI